MVLSIIFMCGLWMPRSFAQRVETDGLTETQRAEVLLNIAKQKEVNEAKKAKAAAPVPPPVTMLNNLPEAPKAEKLSAWTQTGVDLGKGLVAVAKELGIAVNDFAKTPVGILTASVILYKLMGKDIIHLSSGFLFMTTGVFIWIYLVRRILVVDKVTYREELKEYAPGKVKKLKFKETIYGSKWKDTDGFTVVLFTFSIVAILWVGLWIMFSF